MAATYGSQRLSIGKTPKPAHDGYRLLIFDAAAHEAAEAQEATLAANSLLNQATPAQQGASSSAVEAAKAAAQLAWQQAAHAAQSAAEQRAGHSGAERQQGPPFVSGVTHSGDAIDAELTGHVLDCW